MCTRHQTQQRAVVVAIEAIGDRGATLQQLAAIGEALVLLLHGGEIGRRECVAVQFVDLVRKPFDALCVIVAP